MMMRTNLFAYGARALCTAASLYTSVATAPALAQTADVWQFSASIYGYFPNGSGQAAMLGSTSNINIDASDLIKHTTASFMGAFEAHKGRFGAFTDVIYLHLSNSISGARQFSVGPGLTLPPGVSVDTSLGVTMWMATFAGEYRAFETSALNIDIFGGARLLSARGSLGYAFNVDLAPFGGPPRQGSLNASFENWDAIAGVKGRYAFGPKREWFAFGYTDIGTGDSKLTWQGMIGVGRSFGRFDVMAGWRHVAYQFNAELGIKRLDLDGPIIGASVRW